MNETRTNSNILYTTGLGNEKVHGYLKSTGISVDISAYNDGTTAWIDALNATFNLTDKQHLVLSLKSGELVLYVNGSEASRTIKTYTNLSMNLIRVVDYNFDGNIELFKVYKKALSSVEVASAHNSYINK